MLPERITRFATESAAAKLNARQQVWADEVRRIAAELSSKGIRGGPTVSFLSRAAITEIDERKNIVSAELMRAAESGGVSYNQTLTRDLGEAYETIVRARCNDVLQRGRDFGSLSEPERGQFEGVVSIHMVALGPAYMELMHFAEQIRTKRRVTWSERLWHVATLVIGAVLGAALTLATQWLTPHH